MCATDRLYLYVGTHWELISEEILDEKLYLHIDKLKYERPVKRGEELVIEIYNLTATPTRVAATLKAMPAAGRILVNDNIEPPAVLNNLDADTSTLLSCQNGILNLNSRILYPHSPYFFNVNCLDFAYDQDNKQPVEWIKFLKTLWPNDDESINTLMMWMGYCLTNDTRQQKMLLLIGPKRSGKGTIGNIMKILLGATNVCNPTLSSLDSEFGLQSLLNKKLAIVGDARLSNRADQGAIIERLLTISGGDAVCINRKYRDPLPSVYLPTRLMILTNELPRLTDSSGALASRFVPLVMTKSFFGEEDHDLLDKLTVELPAILNWSIDGWETLQSAGRLIVPESSQEMVEDFDRLSSPINNFVKDCCELADGNRVAVDDLYDAWRTWSGRQGIKHATTQQVFGRDLKAAYPTIEKIRTRLGDVRTNLYKGINLRVGWNEDFATHHGVTQFSNVG